MKDRLTVKARLSMQNIARVICIIFTLLDIISNVHASAGELNSRYAPGLLPTPSSPQTSRGKEYNPALDAKKYLGKFGWVDPPDWKAVSPRFNETFVEGNFPFLLRSHARQINRSSNKVSGYNPDMDALSQEEFEAALRNFQRASGLRVTGTLDGATMSMMSKVRCGVPDQTRQLNETISNTQQNVSRRRTRVSTQLFSPFASRTSRKSSSRKPSETLLRRFASMFFRNKRSLRETRRSNVEKAVLASDKIYETEAQFDDIANDWISEGELPEQSRVESMEEVLKALRREKIAGMKDKMGGQPLPHISSPQTPNLIDRIMLAVREFDSAKRRRKRSALYLVDKYRQGFGTAFAKNVITWRLVEEWPSTNTAFMSRNEVWFTVKLAFRMWSEILPRAFREDTTSPVTDVDILIGFGRGLHNRCPVEFKNRQYMREYAHAWPLAKAEIHFNDDQPFVPISWIPNRRIPFGRSESNYPISLLKVAIHEIGHTLGLPHSDDRLSVMNPFYQPFQSKDVVELSDPDRESIKNMYGTCEVSFDVVFDWVRQTTFPNGAKGWKYNTYFFRRDWYWLYENRVGRPRYGDPKLTAEYWRGLMQYPNDPHRKLDGAVHIRTYRDPNGHTFFFKGSIYMEYDNVNDRTKTHDGRGRTYPRRIADDFPGVPYPIDTVFYKFSEKILYFFKNEWVYKYSWTFGRVVQRILIRQEFPGWGGASSLPSNIDAAYFSYAYQAYYFFKGQYYWRLADDRERAVNKRLTIPTNAVGPRRKISSKWKYICDVGPSELVMTLPES